MTRTLCFLLSLATAASLGAQQPATTSAAGGAVPLDRIVGIVSDQALTYFDIQERILQRQQQGMRLPTDAAAKRQLERDVLNEMIDEQLILDKAKELKIEVPDADLNNTVDRSLKDIRAKFASETEFRAELAKAGLGTPDEYRRFLIDQSRRNELIARTMKKLHDDGKIIPANVSDTDVREAFEKNRAQLPRKPAAVTFQQIVVNPKPSDVARAAARAKAESLLVELKSGAEFEKLAKRESMDPTTKDVGGDLGWQRRGVYVPEFDRWIFGPYSLPPGQLSPVVETPFGYHIIRVDRIQTTEVKARHILIRPKVDSMQVERARAEADSVVAAWRAGANFDSLAKKHHDFANKEETSLRTPFPRDSLPATYQTAFAGKKPNDIVTFQIPGPTSGVPKFVVAQLLTVDEGGERTLDEMRELVRSRLAEEGGVRRYLDSLRKQTYVSMRLDAEPPPSVVP
jgi:peptidyl-prolyl cis-trans isomerase SurA